MNAFLRKLNGQQRWLDASDWTPLDESPADCLADLKTDNNDLSLYKLEDDDEDAKALRIAVALRAGAVAVDNVDVIIFPEDLFAGLGITINPTSGETPDPVVNAWHVDAVKVSARQIAAIADRLRISLDEEKAHLKRWLRRDVEAELASALKAQRLQIDQVNPKILDALKDKSLL